MGEGFKMVRAIFGLLGERFGRLLAQTLVSPQSPNRISALWMASPAPTKVVAEYAKSNRSTCKQCGKGITLGSLRLGISTRDPRGFDATKWHHLLCFPKKPSLFSSASKDIRGFSSLKGRDQEELKRLESVEDSISDVDGNEKSENAKKVQRSELEGEEIEEKDCKKARLLGAFNELELAFSTSDVKDSYKDASLPPKWKAFQTIIFRQKDESICDSEKIAAFDFDGCLVNTSVKRIGPDAWSLLYPSIPDRLQNLHTSGYKLVIFTNESNIERWKNKRQVAVNSKIGRLENFLKLVNVPMQVFIACGLGKSKGETDDPFRKPNIGMWRIMEKHFNSGIEIDINQSFYVGDAAGRENDHSDADARFAQSIGLKFYLPEEHFCS